MKPLSLCCVLISAFWVAGAHGEPTVAKIEPPEAGGSQPGKTQPPDNAVRNANAPNHRLVEAIDRVLIISIDGLRPDLLLRAKMPAVRSLCANGSFTFWAETTPEAYTLPCHVSMLTGVSAEKHGVTWNEYIEQSYSHVPTLFDIAKEAGRSTAMAAGKMKFIVFARPGALDDYFFPQVEPVSDEEVALQAVHILKENRPDVMFIHLPGVDTVGHEYGWGSPEQVVAIEQADRAVGRVLNALEELKLIESTLVMLTADHGGAAKGHEMNDARSRFIPWIVAGPTTRKGFDLTLVPDRKIQIEDTFATACAFLGLDSGSECVGKPVLDVLEPSALSQ